MTEQLDLDLLPLGGRRLRPTTPRRHRPDPRQEQAAHLGRVSSVIERHIVRFLEDRGVGGTFHMADLTAYVAERAQVAPDSAGRILRALNSKGVIAYELVSRRESLYRVVGAG